MTVRELLDLLKDKKESKESMEVIISYDGQLLNLSGKDASMHAQGMYKSKSCGIIITVVKK